MSGGNPRDLLDARNRQIPPDEWWSARVNPGLINALRLIHRVSNLPTSSYWDSEASLGRRAPRGQNQAVQILTCIFRAAQEEERHMAEEDAEILADDCPMNGFIDQPTEGGRLPKEAARPDWRDNEAFGSRSAERLERPTASRNLRTTLESSSLLVSGEGGTTTQHDGLLRHDSHGAEPLAFTREIAALPALHAGAFERQHANHQEWAARRASREPPSHFSDAADTARTAGNIAQPAPSAPPLEAENAWAFAMQPSAPITRISQTFGQAPAQGTAGLSVSLAPRSGPARQDEELSEVSTPRRGRPVRTHSSPDLSGAISYADKEKLKGNQRRYVDGLKLKMTPTTYLVDFQAQVENALRKCPHLDEDEKAELILPMLSPEVKNKLEGVSSMLIPKGPEVVMDALKSAYPARVLDLNFKLDQLEMPEQMTATEFVAKAQLAHQQCQVRLPRVYSRIQSIYAKASVAFMQACQQADQMIKSHRKLTGQPVADDYDMPWDDFRKLADAFDSDRAVTAAIRSKVRQSRELKNLAGNQATSSRTRSGPRTPTAAAAAVETQPDRGRPWDSQPYQPRPRSASAHSNKSGGYQSDGYKSGGSHASQYQDRYRDRNKSKSPGRQAQAGGTPFRKDFVKSDGHKRNPSGDKATISMITFPGVNWIAVNLMRPAQSTDEADTCDTAPIVISTLPVSATSTTAVSVNAVNRRPNLPEGITAPELDAADQETAVKSLPEAMRRGLREVPNLPSNSPYAKILNAQFMLTFRQLAGLVGDDEFASICKQLLDLGLQREGRRHTIAQSHAAAQIFKLTLQELPCFRRPLGSTTTPLPEAPVLAATPLLTRDVTIIGMTELKAHLDDKRRARRNIRVDSGAAVSCISAATMTRDAKHLLQHGQLCHHSAHPHDAFWICCSPHQGHQDSVFCPDHHWQAGLQAQLLCGPRLGD